jgi:ferredoxin
MPKQSKILHYRENCIGCNACVFMAPQNWRLNPEDGKSDLLNSTQKGEIFIADLHESDLAANQSAAAACPMQAIKITPQ